jgi:hypothetical protein
MQFKYSSRAFCFSLTLGLLACAAASAQDVQTGVTFVCNGERMEIESCNMRDLSDNTSCLVAHPDRPLHNGFMAYTNETRGALKKLIPTCKQPTAEQIARAQAFAKKRDDTQEAIRQKNLAMMDTPHGPPGPEPPQNTKSQRDKVRVARCLSSGRTETQCVGSEFGKAFEGVFAFAGSMLGVAPPEPGVYLNGVYQGKGGWNIAFQPDSAAMQCSDLISSGHPYKLEFKGTQVVVKVENKPNPLVLKYHDGKLFGSAPVQVAGSIVVGSTAGSGGGYSAPTSSGAGMPEYHTETTSRDMSGLEAEAYQRGGGSGNLQQNGTGYTLSETTTTTTYSHPTPTPTMYTGPTIITAPRTRTCPAPALTASSTQSSQDMGNALSGLAGIFGMDDEKKTAPTPVPVGLRMFGEFAGPGGADIDFHDDVAIVACGMIAAQYPYAVDLSGSQPVLKLVSSGKPTIDLTFGPDRTLVGSGQLQIAGREAIGQNQNGDIAYAQRSVSCPLSTLTPLSDKSSDDELQPSSILSSALGSSAGPSTSRGASANGVAAGNATANTASPSTAKANPAPPAFAKPSAPTGNAVLSVASGFPAQAGVTNPLAGRPYLLLRDNVAAVLAKSGVPIPAGVLPQEAVMAACEKQKPECQKYLAAISADAASGLRSDANGKATLPGVPPGTYYLTASTKIGSLNLYWNIKLDLKAGPNTLVVDQHNAAPVK